MSDYYKQTRQETIIYTIVWFVIFMAPLSEFVVNYDPEHPIWIKNGLLDTWVHLLFFFIAFLIHNHILAPILVKHKKVTKYIVACVAVIALFQMAQCIHKPDHMPNGSRPVRALNHDNHEPPPPDGSWWLEPTWV